MSNEAIADDGPLEIGAFVGGDELGGNFELGNAYYEDQVPGDGLLFGARLHYRMLGRLGLEVEGKLSPARTAGSADAGRHGVPSPLLGFRVHATYDLFRLWRVEPFATLGVGTDTVWVSAPDSYLVETDTDVNAHWGVGTRIALGDRFGARFDARQILGAGRTEATAFGYEATAGLYITFGAGAPDRGEASLAPRLVQQRPRTREPAQATRTPAPSATDDLATRASTRDLRPLVQRDLAPAVNRGVSLQPAPVQNASAPRPGDGEPPPASIETIEQAQAVIASVFYDHGRARLKRHARRALDKVAEYLLDHPTVEIVIVGHADSEGSDRTNIRLSRRRADRAKWYLVDRGVPLDRIDTEGRGEAEPIDSNSTDAGRARNRRIEIELEH